MEKREYPSRDRYTTFAVVLGASQAALVALVTVVSAFGWLLSTGTSADYEAWEERQSLNSFYRTLAGEPVEGDTAADRLARDLVIWVGDREDEDVTARLAAFDAPHVEGETSPYRNVEDELGIPVFSPQDECYDCGPLVPTLVPLAAKAFEGDLQNLVLPAGEAPVQEDEPFWPETETLVVLFLLVSTMAFIGASTMDNRSREDETAYRDETPLVWALDGEHPGPKAVSLVLAPHILGPVLLRHALVDPVQRTLARREARREEALAAERDERARSIMVDVTHGSGVTQEESVLGRARKQLHTLETIEPRTEAVEAATREMREILQKLEAVPGDVAAIEADVTAERVLAEGRALLDVRAATLAAHGEIAHIKQT